MIYNDIVYGSVRDVLHALIAKIDEVPDDAYSDELLGIAGHLDQVAPQVEHALSQPDSDPFLSETLSLLTETANALELNKIDEKLFRKLVIVSRLAVMLENDQSLDFEKEIDFPIDSFAFMADTGPPLPFQAFGFANPLAQIDSIAYFDFNDESWHSVLSESRFNNQLLGCALHVISTMEDLAGRYTLVRDDANPASVHSALRLQAISHGKTIHRPIESSLKPSMNAVSLISAKNEYHQFDETILILSEFNARADILNKFLSLYHVIEGFMYRIPLVNLGASNSGKMFSLRDFRRLYNTLDVKETAAIKETCTLFWDVKIGVLSFSKIVENAIKHVKTLPRYSPADMDMLLAKLEVYEGNGAVQLSNGCTAAKYSQLIYKVRCAIVHNSETELHISHFNLTPTLIYLIDEILMKPLESLVLKLISDKSSKVWYSGPALRLY